MVAWGEAAGGAGAPESLGDGAAEACAVLLRETHPQVVERREVAGGRVERADLVDVEAHHLRARRLDALVGRELSTQKLADDDVGVAAATRRSARSTAGPARRPAATAAARLSAPAAWAAAARRCSPCSRGRGEERKRERVRGESARVLAPAGADRGDSQRPVRHDRRPVLLGARPV